MHISRLTIVAIVIAAATSSQALAATSEAYAQCAALAEQEKLSEARQYCRQAAIDSGDEGMLIYADYQARTGNLSSAIDLYSKLLYVDLTKPTQLQYQALRNRAMTYLEMGDDKAYADIDVALKIAPKDVELIQYAAQFLKVAGRKVEYAERLVALDPNSVDYQITRVFALAESGDFPGAMAVADLALKLSSGSPLAMNARAFVHGKKGDFTKAEKDYAAITRKVPNEPDAWTNHADVLIMLKRPQDAIESASKALALRPNDAHALIVRANAYLSLGNGEAAKADAEKVREKDFVYPAANVIRTADGMIRVQKALTSESVAQLEQDRATVVSVVSAHMHATCGNFSVVPFAVNDGLDEYRDCIENWYRARHDDELAKNESIVIAARRFNKTVSSFSGAESLVCSAMVKKARCIDDGLHARAVAAASNFNNPTVIIGIEEFDRLNREVDVYNAKIERQNKLNRTVDFLQAVSDALAEQSEQ